MIGIFDSGIGGLVVARAFSDRLPGQNVLFYGDTGRSPYACKTNAAIFKHVLEGVGFLVEKGARIIVIVCCESGEISEAVSQKYGIPVFETAAPAAKLAADISRRSVIGVIAGRSAVESGLFERKILEADPHARVWQAACPLLASLVEEGWIKKPETRMIARKYLHPLKVRQIDTLVIGDPHFRPLKHIIRQKIGKRVSCIDMSEAVADNIAEYIDKHPEIRVESGNQTGACNYVTALTTHIEKTAGILFGKKAGLQLAMNS